SVASEYPRHEQGNPFALISGAPSHGRFYGIFVPWITVLYSCNLVQPPSRAGATAHFIRARIASNVRPSWATFPLPLGMP
ncbi:MAG TPA: hypothetical protein VN764_16620, partial [Polyangiaceae bacterium]|nr:hypothetical protein [Polyangiaceae bacterium]